MCSTQHSSTSSKRWRVFGLINVLITPQVRSKLSQSPEQCWRRCGNMNTNHSHIFWLCPNIQIFWENVCLTMTEMLEYKFPSNVESLYFCILKDDVIWKKDWYLCKILLMACKKAITKNWYKTESASLNQWMDRVKEIYAMGKTTFCLRNREVAFHRKWEKCTAYIKGIEDPTY